MIRSNSRATTLVELMVVVAIISIVTTGLMASLVGPVRETKYAAADLDYQSGLGRLYSQLTIDAHSAVALGQLHNPKGVSFTLTTGGTVYYYVDGEQNLRRVLLEETNPLAFVRTLAESPSLGALQLANVTELSASPTDDERFWNLALIGTKPVFDETNDYEKNYVIRIRGLAK